MYAGLTGWQTGWQAARRVFEDPATAQQQNDFEYQASQYNLLWSYYNHAMFDKSMGISQQYKSNYNLYRNIRLIYNPVRRLVDFYSGQVYPGVLSEDGAMLPDGIPLAVPFSEDTPPELKSAIAQFWQWSNWQAKKAVHVRYGAALGNVLIEVVDDVERGKVTAEICWPGFVKDLDLDAAGNVRMYIIEYKAKDPDGTMYTYRKEMDKQVFRYYRDDLLIQETANPYGFTPAVWIKHNDVGSQQGSPAVAGSLAKIDELNNLASHVHDQIHKVIGAPVILWTSGGVQNLFNKEKRGATSDFEEPKADQESILMLKGPADGKVDSLAGDLNLADSLVYMKELLAEIEQDHPELVFYRELREMTQVTGPAASRLAGDVAARVSEAQAAYDNGNISLFRMALAIAGFRANSGAWGPLNRQQEKFTPFNLDSYERGDLDMSIMPRPLLTPTKLETAMETQAVWTGVKLATEAGVPLELILKQEGWTDKEIAELEKAQDKEAKAREAAIEREQRLSREDVEDEIEQ